MSSWSELGGKQTMRVPNIEAQLQALPMRRLFETDVVEPLRALQSYRVKETRDLYNARKWEIEVSDLSMEERLDARRNALRDMRVAVAAAYRELKPQPFGEWLQEREKQRGRIRSTSQQHERSIERDHNREESFSSAEQSQRSDDGLDLER